ncbi:MAG: AI-2E family transporter [Lachnospiraceae bacterium]|nr:AI-2E family transporter [Lachnospiraceae bacterium]
MKYHGDRKYLHWGLTGIGVVCAGIAFYYILFHGTRLGTMLNRFFNICFPIIVGFVLAYLFTPVVNSIEYRLLIPLYKRITKGKKQESIGDRRHKSLIRAIAICTTYLLVFWCFYGLFAMIIPEIEKSIPGISEQTTKAFNKYYDMAIDYLQQNTMVANFLKDNLSIDLSTINSQDVVDWLLKNIQNIGSVLSTLSATIYGTLKTSLNIIIGFIISVYLLFGKETYAAQAKKICYSLFEMHNANRLIKDCRFIHKTFIGFISGKIFDSIIIGFLCFIGTTLLGLHYPVLISVIVGVTNVIPFFGPYLGAIPCTLLLLVVAPIEAVYFLIFVLILQQVDGNIIGPRILGDSTGISGFWVIFAITFFGGIYGIMGMIIGVPVFAVIYAFTKRFVNRRLKSKSLPSDTALYRDAYEIRDGEFITKEHLFTEIKNPKGSSQHKNAAEEGEKYHLFRTLFSRHATGSSESAQAKDASSEKENSQKTEASQSKEESNRNT